jgi:hypothetical protein
VNLILHQINKLIEKGVQILIKLVWKDNVMVCDKRMTTLSDTVNENGNLNNENINWYFSQKQSSFYFS